MRVGILELLLDTVTTSYTSAVFGRLLRRQFYSIMPQVVAVWARGLGHEVHYATYYGQSDPANLLPADLDIVFISTYTQASALANAMSVFYRMGGALTVAGGGACEGFPGGVPTLLRHCRRQLRQGVDRRYSEWTDC